MSEVDKMTDAKLGTLQFERDAWRQYALALLNAVAVTGATSDHIVRRLVQEAELPVACEAQLLKQIEELKEELQKVRDQCDSYWRRLAEYVARETGRGNITQENDPLKSECPSEAGAGIHVGKQAQGEETGPPFHPKTGEAVTCKNSLVDGRIPHRKSWDRLDFSRARIDPGPSPAGNDGPYLQVPTNDEDELDQTTHRVYPR